MTHERTIVSETSLLSAYEGVKIVSFSLRREALPPPFSLVLQGPKGTCR